MEFGEIRERLRRRAEAGKPTPAWERRPRLHPGLAELWRAFEELGAARDPGRRIKVTEAEAWFRLNDTPAELRPVFWRFISAMDSEAFAFSQGGGSGESEAGDRGEGGPEGGAAVSTGC